LDGLNDDDGKLDGEKDGNVDGGFVGFDEGRNVGDVDGNVEGWSRQQVQFTLSRTSFVSLLISQNFSAVSLSVSSVKHPRMVSGILKPTGSMFKCGFPERSRKEIDLISVKQLNT